MATKAELLAQIAALQAAPAAVATVAAPVQAEPAVAVEWVQQAVASAPKAPKAVKAATGPKPLKMEIITQPAGVRGDGTAYAAFKVLHIHNGANGKFYRGVRLDARYLAAIRSFTGTL